MNETIPVVKKRKGSPWVRAFQNIIDSFSATEKVLFYAAFWAVLISTILLIGRLHIALTVEVPTHGGSLTEGIIGTPAFANPLLAESDADRDLVELVYSGLVKTEGDGSVIPDLASGYTVSEDGKIYEFTLKDNIFFHDGTPLTAEDVLFTVKLALDPSIKSVERLNWEGVEAEIVDAKTIRFTLKQPYAPFIDNATIGILPKHLWKNVEADQFATNPLNSSPIGSGPYKVSSVVRTNNVISSYSLDAYKKYALGTPLLSHVVLKFYSNEDALFSAYKNGEVESLSSVSPSRALDASAISTVETASLPRIFGVFFNQNQNPIFLNKEVRQALSLATNKKEIIDSVLHGYGTALDSPFPPGILKKNTPTQEVSTTTATSTVSKVETATSTPTITGGAEGNLERAIALLQKNGWKKNTDGVMEKTVKKEKIPLTFTLSTSNAPELAKTAELLKKQWEQLGAAVELKISKPGELNQDVIRPRKYDALLFGEIVGRDLDLYAFWHSSERIDPGLNIALYTNSRADKALETARTSITKEDRQKAFDSFAKEIQGDTPAIFIYAPDFIYIVPITLHDSTVGHVTEAHDRFAGIRKWYKETDRVWNLFTK